MRLNVNDTIPIEQFPYLEVAGGQLNQNGNPKILHKTLPIYLGKYAQPKAKVDYLIVCSDLQGMVKENEEYRLLGEILPEFLKLLLEIELEVSVDAKIGVLLCGDLFTSLDKRGASGDVRSVWKAFNHHFDWVVGVAGNHDRFGNEEESTAFKGIEHIHLLHQENIEIDGLKIGGISGIIGRSDKPQRVEEKAYLDSLKRLLKQSLDFVLLHETPDFPPNGFIGNEKIRTTIEAGPASRIIAGHCYWEKTLV